MLNRGREIQRFHFKIPSPPHGHRVSSEKAFILRKKSRVYAANASPGACFSALLRGASLASGKTESSSDPAEGWPAACVKTLKLEGRSVSEEEWLVEDGEKTASARSDAKFLSSLDARYVFHGMEECPDLGASRRDLDPDRDDFA
jgi:hypothetical protein